MKHTLAYAVITISLVFYGCGAPADFESTTHPNPSSSVEGSDTQSGSKKEGQSDMEKMKVELAKLSKEDAASALRQHVCPVSDEMLGTMGAPIKVDVNGQQVWICCEGCRKRLLGDPDEFLAKLKN